MTTYPPNKAARAPIPEMVRFAFLNTRRHKLRAIANIIGIAVATASLVFFLGFYRGTYDGIMFATVIDNATAHFQIQSEFFDEDDADTWLTEKTLFGASDGDSSAEASQVGARALAGRIVSLAFAGDGARKVSVMLAGVDFDLEKKAFRLSKRIKEGEFGSGAVIGARLAKSLNIELGDEIRLQARTADGAPNLDYWTVTGIFSAGYPPIDRGMVYIPLEEAQEFLGASGKINKVYFRAVDKEAGAVAMAQAKEILDGTGLSVREWKEFAKAIVEDAKGDSFFFALFIVILLLLSLSTVAGTMQVTVYERKREIGMMRACGWLRKEIAFLFTLEAFVIGIAGAALGCAVGGIGTFLLQTFPIKLNMSDIAIDIPEFSLTCGMSGWDFVIAFLAGAVTALLAGISPARRAARTSILSAMSER